MPLPDNQSAAASNLPDLPPGYTLDGSPEPSSSASFSTGVSSQSSAADTSAPPLPAGYKMDEQQPAATDDYPWSKAYPFSPSDPGSRLARSFTEGSGLPADITKWREAIRSMGNDPLTGRPGPHGPSIFNAPANIVKGIASGSASASQRGIDQFNQPGAVNKTVGGLKYIIGGLPIAGPAIVKSMEEAEKGNYTGMFGTLGSMGMQALIANPEAAATHLDAAGKYLFSKPRVQETILAGEAKEMLTAAEAAARAKGKAKFPESDATLPGPAVSNIASKAIADHIQGSPETPGPLKSMMADDSFKRVGAIERVGGGLQDIFSRMASDDPVTMRDAHGYYTELGRYAERDLPGDVYKAVKQTRDDLGELIGDQYKSERDPVTGANLNKYPQWEDAKSYWSDLHKHWWDTDSPLYKAMNSSDPHETLQALLGPSGDSADRTAAYLRNYTNEGADPKIVKAATTLFKGMDQMRIRGLYQASGGLLLAMMLREFGVPTAVNAATVATLLSSRLAKGYFNTRPSLTSLLSDEIKPSTWRSYPLKDDPNIRGNPSPFGGGGGPVAQPPPPAPVAPVPAAIPTVDHSASTLTPTETTFLSAIKDHPDMHADLRADIEATIGAAHDKLKESVVPTGDFKTIPIERLKGIMDIMKYQKMGYNEATKIYDSINHPSAAPKPATTSAGSDLNSQIKEFSDVIRDPNSSLEQREVARQMRSELRAKRSVANRAELEGIIGDMQSKVREAADKHYQESIPIQDALEKAIDNIRKLRGEPAASSAITPRSSSTLGPNWLQQLTDRLSNKDPVDVKYDLKQVIDVLEKRDPDYANRVVNGFATHYWVKDALKAALDSGDPSFVLARMKELQSKLGH